MTHCLVRWFVFVGVFVGALPGFAEESAPGLVTVDLLEGRRVWGVVDARTDSESLWLRRDSLDTSLTVSVAWEDLAAAELNGRAIDKEALRRRAGELATRRTTTEVWSTPSYEQAHSLQGYDSPSVRSVVASLRITGEAANWDADAGDDGLVIRVAAVDASGRLAPVRGALRVRMFGERRVSRHQRRYEQLALWSTPVRVADFHEGAAVYRLPFRSLDPEHDLDVGTLARIDAQLNAFGHGVFDATAPVRLREFDPLADGLQQATGRRRFREERAVSGRRPTPAGDGLFRLTPIGP